MFLDSKRTRLLVPLEIFKTLAVNSRSLDWLQESIFRAFFPTENHFARNFIFRGNNARKIDFVSI
jgi:hypothetical protein